MRNVALPLELAANRVVKPAQKAWLRRLAGYVGASLGAMVLGIGVLVLVFGDAFLNGHGRAKAERAFAKAHPGYALRIGALDYRMGANRLIAQSVTLSATNTTLKVGRISLTGVRWARLLWGEAALAEVLADASLEAANLEVKFPQAQYGIRCARLRASVPDSEMIAEGVELQPLVGDEDFFAAHFFRKTRFHVTAPECRVSGLAYSELLQGKAYRARAVHISRPSFDALVNCDKPPPPFAKSPLMVHEALAAIQQPLQVDRLTIAEGHLTYGERSLAGAEPGVVTFGDVGISVDAIANHGGASDAIQIEARGDLMNAGTLKVRMTIPITSPDFSLHYSGSLSAMDLPRLNAFLEIMERLRIKSGSVQEVAFEINVTAGQARGRVRAIYKDLVIAVLDRQTGTEKGVGNRLASLLANALKIRNANAPDAAGLMKEGNVNYTRKPEDEFVQFAWFALRSGVLDLISH
jgi:hypothetical protein